MPGKRKHSSARESHSLSQKRHRTRRTSNGHRNRAHRPLSAVELLPTEILEHIFSYTVNPAFPRSSLVIGRNLSSEATYRRHCLVVFASFASPWWKISPLPSRFVDHSALLAVVEDETGKTNALNETLKCRWLTPKRYAQARSQLLARELEVKRRACSQTGFPWRGEIQHPLGLDFGMYSYIPSRLLRNPLRPGNRELLCLLVHDGCGVDTVRSLNGELLVEALEKAAVGGDHTLMEWLMQLESMRCPLETDLMSILNAANWNPSVLCLILMCCIGLSRPKGVNSPPVNFPYPLDDTVRLRTREFGDTYPKIYIKLRAMYSPLSWEDTLASAMSPKLKIESIKSLEKVALAEFLE